jgi:hypothetical protein
MADPKPETVVKHDNIHAALSAFQGELKPMAKTGEVEFPMKSGNGKVKFNYTPLGEIMAAIYPLLAKHGLSVRHEIVRGGTLGTKEGIEAILTHQTYKEEETENEETVTSPDGTKTERTINSLHSTNELRSGVVFINQGSDMKDIGAAITYARRYTLTMLLGISSEDDKDAELLEQSAQNAVQSMYTRAKKGIEDAATGADTEKALKVLKNDLATLEKGKAPSLGLKKEQYVELIAFGEKKVADLDANQGGKGGKEE